MKRFELILGGLIAALVVAAIVAMLTIPRAGPAGGSGLPADPMADPARKLWKADPEASIYIFGEAVRPGAHAVPATGWTPSQVVAAVEGFTPAAAGRFRVLRKVNAAVTEVLNIPRAEIEASTFRIEPADVIYLD